MEYAVYVTNKKTSNTENILFVLKDKFETDANLLDERDFDDEIYELTYFIENHIDFDKIHKKNYVLPESPEIFIGDCGNIGVVLESYKLIQINSNTFQQVKIRF